MSNYDRFRYCRCGARRIPARMYLGETQCRRCEAPIPHSKRDLAERAAAILDYEIREGLRPDPTELVEIDRTKAFERIAAALDERPFASNQQLMLAATEHARLVISDSEFYALCAQARGMLKIERAFKGRRVG